MEDYFYDDDDMLTEIKIGATVVKSFGYDGAGRRTSATYSGVTTTYSYDYESRITGITRTGVTANSFAYNGFDTRVSKTDSSGSTAYNRAGAGVTSSLLKSTVSSTTTDYTPGVSFRVSGYSTFMHSGIKNADEQTDDNGDISASRHYDAFGNLVSSNGPWAGPFGYGGPYGYQTDNDHGLMLLGHRYYESDTGRFLTRDPIKDGRNWYVYCDGSPVTHSDPFGLQKSYWQQVGEVGLGYLDAINPWEWAKGGYETGRTILDGLAQGDLLIGHKVSTGMIIGMIEGICQLDDPRRFGRSLMSGLLLAVSFAKGIKTVKGNRGGLSTVKKPAPVVAPVSGKVPFPSPENVPPGSIALPGGRHFMGPGGGILSPDPSSKKHGSHWDYWPPGVKPGKGSPHKQRLFPGDDG